MTESIKITGYLAGFYATLTDFNYNLAKGNIFNKFTSYLNCELEIKKELNMDVLTEKNATTPLEIRMNSNTLIFQSQDGYDKFTAKAFKLLEIWREYNPQAENLNLCGLVINYGLTMAENKESTHKIKVTNEMLQLPNAIPELLQFDMHCNFKIEKQNQNYNVHINLNEDVNKGYLFYGAVDINRSLSTIEIENIFSVCKEYYKNEFKQILKTLNL